QGKHLTESETQVSGDPRVRFTAPRSGKYQVRIHDINFQGSQSHVYRLTLTADPYVDRVFPLGGKRGTKLDLEVTGQGLPHKASLALPAHGNSWAYERLGKSNLF